MWISRRAYDDLVDRLERLERRTPTPPTVSVPNVARTGALMGCYYASKCMPVTTAVEQIIEHLGLELKEQRASMTLVKAKAQPGQPGK